MLEGHLEGAQDHPAGPVADDPRALAVARVAAQPASRARARAVVARHELGVGVRVKPPHACVGFVDGVPAQALLDAADGREAAERVKLQRAVYVVARDANRPPTLTTRLDQRAAGHTDAAIVRELGEQALEVVGRELDVAVEITNVREGREL